MPIHLKGYLTFRELIGERVFDSTSEQMITLVDLLRKVAREAGDSFRMQIYDDRTEQIQPGPIIMINGRSYKSLPKAEYTCLKDGDEVAIFPPFIGGSL